MSIKILIVEDELIHAWNIEQMLSELGGYEVLSICQDAETALKYITETGIKIDIALIDIHLKSNINGIELARKIAVKKIPIIFITHDESEKYYSQAKTLTQYSFLIKPFYKFTLDSVIRLLLTSLSTPPIDTVNYIKVGYKREMIDTKNIYWIESDRNYCTIYTNIKTYTVKRSLKALTESLPIGLFVTVHKSFLVQLSLIKRINIKEQTILVNDSILPLGRSYIKSLRGHLSHLG